MRSMGVKKAGGLARINWQQSFKNRQTAGNSAVFIRPTLPNRPLLVSIPQRQALPLDFKSLQNSHIFSNQ